MSKKIEGIIAAIVTPFDTDDNINFNGFKKIINYLIDNKIHGILPAGSQGEFYRMDWEATSEHLIATIHELRNS